MAKFLADEDFRGFDGEDPTAPWQMIPLKASRSVKLVGGNDDMEVVVTSNSAPAAGLEKLRGKRVSASDRIVPLFGDQAGSYEVQALDPKTKAVQARLSSPTRPASPCSG